ncbi:hypothetical protein KP77_28540 [Jeotgalibacillus alimentarius]|uniref:Uncharacterized protein n=1 Tax=Jeotgalibacillus alimentarius TaxID=135826 RepID=A0A0C2V9E4_9BACL|nr:hypothetical protein [Jeotgalibacillus alimentarius]KIL45562.1 hypothetical protein KP77_28540 [Jeotgalibacillus alimentarius]
MTTTNTINLEQITYPEAKAGSSRSQHGGVLSIVNASKNSKRLMFSSKVSEHLNNPESVQIGFLDTGIIVAEHLTETAESYVAKQTGKKKIVYNAELVREISEMFDLNFNGGVSLTFYEATYTEINDEPVVVIRLQSQSEEEAE